MAARQKAEATRSGPAPIESSPVIVKETTQVIVAETNKEAEQQIPEDQLVPEERGEKRIAEEEAGLEESPADKRPGLEELDVVLFVVQPKIKNRSISFDASALKDPTVALSLAALVLLPANKATFRAEPDLVAIALAAQSALLVCDLIFSLFVWFGLHTIFLGM